MARAPSPAEALFVARTQAHPDAPWLHFEDDTYTWAEALSNIRRAQNGLLELGVTPGQRVGIMMGNRPEFLWVHFGVTFLGAASVPINTSQRGATLEHILADSDSVAIVFERQLLDAVRAVRDRVSTLRWTVGAETLDGEADWSLERLLDRPDTVPDIPEPDEEPAIQGTIMYTSGTTGPPKGVVYRRSDGPASPPRDAAPTQAPPPGGGLFAIVDVKPGETVYTCLPLFHGNALAISTQGSIQMDCQIALGRRFSASGLWNDCRKHDAVEFNALGAMIPMLLKQPARPDDRDHPVRSVFSAACPAWAWRDFEERFGVRIVEGYAMVDAPGLILNTVGKVGSMGKPVPMGVEFAIIDDDENPLPAGTVGELVMRHLGGQPTEYHKRPDATAEAYRGGWFHTGDLAETDEEGFYYFRGRKKASIRRRGENISAWEIESVVNQHPAVLESAAHAVSSDLGEDEVKLVVVPQPGQSPTPEELLDFCAGKMAYYAIPRYVEFVDEIPKTGTHRVQYEKMRERGITPETWDREAAGYAVQRV